MSTTENLPRLRPLEILHIQDEEGNPAYLLRDPQGFSEEEMVLTDAGLFMAAFCDGEHDMAAAQAGFAKRAGVTPDEENVLALVKSLDAAHFLEGPGFDAHAELIVRAFDEAHTREAALAGIAYEADPAQAREQVDTFFREGAALPPEEPPVTGTLRALIAPHIDLRVGGACSGAAYAALRDHAAAETVIVLGTGHACPDPGWIVLDKPFETPLGTVPVDTELCARLAGVAPASAQDLFLHRREHSVEFQALFLAALRAEGRDLRMVPVLSGSLREEESPGDDPFLTELAAILEESGDRVIVIAGADLAHVGPRFGDAEELGTEHLELLETKDRATLAVAAKGDARGFFDSVTESGDPRRICGLSPIYGMLQALPGDVRGHTLRYEQATDPTGTVSYASMVFRQA